MVPDLGPGSWMIVSRHEKKNKYITPIIKDGTTQKSLYELRKLSIFNESYDRTYVFCELFLSNNFIYSIDQKMAIRT